MREYGIVKGKMSTSPCSQDLRKKVIDYINKGKTNKEAAEIFGLHRNTISRWKLSYIKNGSYAAKPRLGYKSRLDYLSIEMFIKDNQDLKLSDIGVKFHISSGHAGRILKKLGYSYKKKASPTWRLTKKSEKDI